MPIPWHGKNIFIYANIQTKQVVYSLTRSLDNNAALKQIPYIGKKSKPPALRRDHWAPLATVTTPLPSLGLSIYRRLREFRVMHETMYTDEKLLTMDKKKRKYELMNQYANSIADLSASIEIELPPAVEKWVEDGGAKQLEKMGEEERDAVSVNDEGQLQEIKIQWRNVLDAEYARQWPKGVKHSIMGELHRYTAPPPDLEAAEEVKRKREEKLEAKSKAKEASKAAYEAMLAAQAKKTPVKATA